VTTPSFRALYGDDLADTVDQLCQSPEQQQAARELEAQLAIQRRNAEAQVLKEICDGADNKVYGKEGQDIAKRFPSVDGVRDYYMQVGLRDALQKAGLLGRGKRKR
jgi:hypothetical protein